jgi:hypothetical protein
VRDVRSRRLTFEVLERRSLLSLATAETPFGTEQGIGDVSESWLEAEAPATNLPPLSESLSDRPLGIVNRRVTSDAGVQQMPSIAVDPQNANHLVLAYMDYSLVLSGYAGIGVAVSDDAGASWQDSSIPLPAEFDQGAANPVVRFDDRGQVFVSFMAATFLGEQPPLTNPNYWNPERNASDRDLGLQANNGIFVARSRDGGLTWGTPVAVISHLYQGEPVPFEVIPDLAIDTFAALPDGQPNPNHGNLYVAWTHLFPPGQYLGQPSASGGSDIWIAVSTDGGLTWQIRLQEQQVWIDADGDGIQQPNEFVPVRVSVIRDALLDPIGGGAPPGLGACDQAHLAIGPEGDIYLSNYGGNDFTVHHSADAGVSFDPPDHATGYRLAFGTGNKTGVSSDGLPNNRFRTHAVRAIAADPVRPGFVYAVEYVADMDPLGNILDAADVYFVRSTDYGEAWQTATPTGILNDDNAGRMATGLSADQVIAGQALPRLTVDAQGDIGVIWYDTRRDPADHLLDVFGTVSTDGGQTFSPNFRITEVSFDADRGAFTDAVGKENFYLGDFVGLAMSDGSAYAAWTDTRAGNQDVFTAQFPLHPAPAPLNDRFEPNNSVATATDIGRVLRRFLPKLGILAGDDDWFRLQAAATGPLTATAQWLGEPGLQLELWDESGTNVLATGINQRDAQGAGIRQQLVFLGRAGQTYLVHVLAADGAGTASYSLDLQSLTANLGTRVHGVQSGTLALGDEAFYLLSAGAAGSLKIQFRSAGNVEGTLNHELLDPAKLSVLARGQPTGDTGGGGKSRPPPCRSKRARPRSFTSSEIPRRAEISASSSPTSISSQEEKSRPCWSPPPVVLHRQHWEI